MKHNYDHGIHSNPDAKAWAEFFIKCKFENKWTIDNIDEGLMISWFANAMMAEHDHIHQTKIVLDKPAPDLREAVEAMEKELDYYKKMFVIGADVIYNTCLQDLPPDAFAEWEKEIDIKTALKDTPKSADLREAEIAALQKQLAEAKAKHETLVALLREAKCPNNECDGNGVMARVIHGKEYVTRDMAIDAGDVSLEGSLYRDDEIDYEQCQWCAEREQSLAQPEKG